MGDSRGYEKAQGGSSGGAGGDATSISGNPVNDTGLVEDDIFIYNGSEWIVQPGLHQLQIARMVNFDGLDIFNSEYVGYYQNGSSVFFAQVAGAVNASPYDFVIKHMVFAFNDPVDEQQVFFFRGLDESPLIAGLINLVNTPAPGNPAYEYIVSGLDILLPSKYKAALKFDTDFFNTKMITVAAWGKWVR